MASATAPRAPEQLSYKVRIIGARRTDLHDLYHAMLQMSWWGALGVIAAVYLGLNALFALAYLWVGGIANVAEGSFIDAFFFSVQTMGTIGYGWMYPVTRAANGLVVAESLTGLVVTALATGLVFVRFSQTRARLRFSHRVTIGPMNGVPTLMVRVGNERNNQIFDATFKLTLMSSTVTAEGNRFYMSYDLLLLRSHSSALTRSWNALHVIDASSPLHKLGPAELAKMEAEFTLSVTGIDETSLQSIYARQTYESHHVVWGARLADLLSEEPGGDLVLDLRKFHELVPTAPSEAFPYPAKSAPTG